MKRRRDDPYDRLINGHRMTVGRSFKEAGYAGLALLGACFLAVGALGCLLRIGAAFQSGTRDLAELRELKGKGRRA